MKAKNTHKRSFLRELMLLCKRYDFRFDEDLEGGLVISQLNSLGTPEEFMSWLEDAEDFEATELEKKRDVSVAASSPMQDRIERRQIYEREHGAYCEATELEKKEKKA